MRFRLRFFVPFLSVFLMDFGSVKVLAQGAPPAELAGVEVLYFEKPFDNPVVRALKKAGVTPEHRSTPSDQMTSESNTLTCTPDVTGQAIKKTAILLLDAGVKLKVIAPSIYGSQFTNRITIESYEGGEDLVTLSREVIASLNHCPTHQVTMPVHVAHESDRLGPNPAQALTKRRAFAKAKVLECLAAGYETRREMYICSGGMFTPELLSTCVLGGQCDYNFPAFAIDGFLTAKEQNWGQSLTVTSPTFDKNAIIKCVSTTSGTVAKDCLSRRFYPQPSPEVSACGSFEVDVDALASCIVSRLGSPWNTAVGCVIGAQGNNPSACLAALLPPDTAQRISSISECARRAGAEVSRETFRCFVPLLPEEYRPIVTCALADDFSKIDVKLTCLNGLPGTRPAVAVISCAAPNQALNSLVISCASALARPLSAQARMCLQNGTIASCLPSDPLGACVSKFSNNSLALTTCLVERQGDLVAAVRLAQCVLNAGNPSDFVAVCLPVDESIRVPIACALQQTTRDAILACAAARFLNNDQRRLLSCAMASQSYVEFATCYAGIRLTHEQAIVVKCLGRFGPTPQGAYCAAGAVTFSELEKCTRGIGTANGCLGPNNEITHAFGKVSDLARTAPGIAGDAFRASVQVAVTNVEQFGKELADLRNGLNQCAQNSSECPQVAIDFCRANLVMCATGLPIPGTPSLAPIRLPPLPPAPQVPAPSCNLQWKCEHWQCSNMCG